MTEDQRDEAHRHELASVMSEYDDFYQRVSSFLAFLEREDAPAPLNGLLLRAYHAGRLNPIEVSAPTGGVGAVAPAEAQPKPDEVFL